MMLSRQQARELADQKGSVLKNQVDGYAKLVVLIGAGGIAQLAIGASHFDDCSGEEWVAKYNVGSGGLGLLILLFNFTLGYLVHRDLTRWVMWHDPSLGFFLVRNVNYVLALLYFGWFVIGQMWTHGMGDAERAACNTTLYEFTFHFFFVQYLLVFALFAFAIGFIWQALQKKPDDDLLRNL